MPRIRYLKPEFFSDEDLAELKFETRLTFAGLWNYADKEGRMEDRPRFLKAMIFPYDNVDFVKQLDILCKPKKSNGQPFIIRYKGDDGRQLIEILNWHKHQKPHHTEAPSKFPPAPPFKEKIMGMGMGMEKQDDPSKELRNGDLTVIKPLIVEPIDIFNLFKEICKNIPHPAEINKSRREKLKTRISEHKDLFWWENLFRAADMVLIPERNGRKAWMPTFDWLIENDKNSLKVLEGNYPTRMESLSPEEKWLLSKEEQDRREDEKRGQKTLRISHKQDKSDASGSGT